MTRITVKAHYLPATDTRGSRHSVRDLAHNLTTVHPFDYAAANAETAAVQERFPTSAVESVPDLDGVYMVTLSDADDLARTAALESAMEGHGE